ncbi:hypothetical protein [Stakelama marina]|uniref:Secreted protein n=1 Tax=Stakelama marina TaxID=2826939 RepID=A0A8T4ICW2_9SPHN|nr:hypothetical protein [Stakelama marina]MBR0552313.1 hypothetical protein [Stakelama marina]
MTLMKSFFLITAILVALNPPAGGAEKSTKHEKRVCHREASTGSIMPKVVCRTAAEAKAEAERAKREADGARQIQREHMQMQTQSGSGG